MNVKMQNAGELNARGFFGYFYLSKFEQATKCKLRLAGAILCV